MLAQRRSRLPAPSQSGGPPRNAPHTAPGREPAPPRRAPRAARRHVAGRAVTSQRSRRLRGDRNRCEARPAAPTPHTVPPRFNYARLSHPPVTFNQEKLKVAERLPAARAFIVRHELNETIDGDFFAGQPVKRPTHHPSGWTRPAGRRLPWTVWRGRPPAAPPRPRRGARLPALIHAGACPPVCPGWPCRCWLAPRCVRSFLFRL